MGSINESKNDIMQPEFTKSGLPRQTPLNVIIVGAGIGGLTAAIGLRRNGHKVTLLEQSRFANETGAAIHLCPNANGLLRHYGMPPEDFGAVTVHSVKDYTSKGNVIKKIDMTESSKLWQNPWQLSHRVRLHETLKKTATSPDGIGTPATLHVSSRVAAVDPQSATVTLENGDIIQADLVVGADGLRSVTRKAVVGHSGKLIPSGKAAFRFLIPREAALSVAGSSAIMEESNQLSMWFLSDRRVVMYPCNDNELLNFVCIHPEHESQGSSEEWNKNATLDQVLKVYEGFDPRLLNVIRVADPESIKVWKLIDMENLPTWINGKVGLLGDAAHPFLPHQGQGGGVAIEDAVALAVVFSGDTTPEEVPERLKLYEKVRFERAHAIQEFSRQAGADFVDGKPRLDLMKYVPYNFGHDEYHNSTKVLANWKISRSKPVYQRMPLVFGVTPGPRQDSLGHSQVSGEEKFVTATIKFRSSRTFLQNLFPSESFKFKSPATVVTASFRSTTVSNMNWLGGRGYNHFGLYLHDVLYTKRDGSVVDGTYLPILFENLTDPILSGRDELGMPKVYCDLDIQRQQSSYTLKASWQAQTFGTFVIEDLHTTDTKEEVASSDARILVYKYSPAVGKRGTADCEYPVVVHHGADAELKPQTTTRQVSSSASISFESLDTGRIPTLHHIVSKLAEIPIYSVIEASVVNGSGVPDLISAERIE
ncbi:FAD/NAD(P)-binding protein [Glarea lozoyensis ATCC 20868]|uniref:FAD/NAD(P)-binding protein n=1 Tax=Glarea lozoyensis (strain ATCC 20868 / MF5171) TaxID=1116229 RepID=S3DCL4_GLAL2|nr:FAD/NAD(P)-binding protein [Glarea lozoyensis ATCC 20868]EPE34794.1 FAD/NAD(P)-binding protein [Glarea lozoyensis ATCC 20868]